MIRQNKEILECPNCNSKNILTRIKTQIRYCRICGQEWSIDESRAVSNSPRKSSQAFQNGNKEQIINKAK